MAVKIRLARAGAKKKPYYKLVVANADAPRDGKFLEKVGTYNPMLPKDDENRVVLVQDRIKYWMSVGAQPTERVEKFLEKAKLIKTGVKRIIKKPITQTENAEAKIVKVTETKENK
jgi:small subunit ribosomal protein S16